MGVITIVYTVMGGLKAVVYTDTIQWLILMGGLLFIGIPLGYIKVGGYQVITDTIPQNFFSLTNVTWQTLLKWFVTIVPIWFVGMTLYQRIYASNSVKQAKRAWFYAGLFEYPVMAFMGVLLGLFGRVAYENGMFTEIGFAPGSGLDAEMGLPLLLRTVLPVGLMGIMVAAYFSAIMSTADSCLMASSGNILTDILGLDEKKEKQSQIFTDNHSFRWHNSADTCRQHAECTRTDVVFLCIYGLRFICAGCRGSFLETKYTPGSILVNVIRWRHNNYSYHI